MHASFNAGLDCVSELWAVGVIIIGATCRCNACKAHSCSALQVPALIRCMQTLLATALVLPTADCSLHSSHKVLAA